MSSRGSAGAERGSRPEKELARLVEGTGRDLRTLQIKLTFVGTQTKAIPTVAFTTFHHLLQLEWFRTLRTTGLSYANDEQDLWNFTVLPEEMLRVAQALAGHDATRRSFLLDRAWVSLAVVLRDSRLGTVEYEVVLDQGAVASVNAAIRDALDEHDSVGRHVLGLQLQLLS